MSDTSGGGGQSGYYPGHQSPEDDGSDFTRHSFVVDQALGYVRTHVLVKIVKVTPNKNNALMPPTVDVQILTKQTDGQGGATSHGTIHNIPVKRNQSGDCVIISDPVEGDIGEMAVHDRDISGAVSSQSETTPGSFRRHDPADGVYYGTVGSQKTPAHYIQFQRDGNGNVTSVNLTSSAGWNVNGITVDKNGNAAFPGTITAKGNITAGYGGGDSVTLQNHTHPGTGAPTPGT